MHLQSLKLRFDILAMLWVMRILLQNGLAFFITLTVGDVFAGLAITVIYKDSFGKPVAELRGEHI